MPGRIHVRYDGELRLIASVLRRLGVGAGAAKDAPEAKPADDVANPAARGRAPAEPRGEAAAYLAELSARFGGLPAPDDARSTPAHVLFDLGALAALARGEERPRRILGNTVRNGSSILVAATALVDERFGPLAQRIADAVPVDGAAAACARTLGARARLNLPADALLVAIAARLFARTAIVTADAVGIAALVRACDGADIEVLGI